MSVKRGSTVFQQLTFIVAMGLLAISFVPGLPEPPLLICEVWPKKFEGHSMVNARSFAGCQLTQS